MEKGGEPKTLAVVDNTSNHDHHSQHQDIKLLFTKPSYMEASNKELHSNSMKRQDSLNGPGDIYEV
jgi:hypothetical protein